MKSYTDIEQSRELEKILPLESADMGWYYSRNPNTARNQMWVGTKTENADIPCWSLSALVEIFDRDYGLWYCYDNNKSHCTKHCDNPLDSAFDLVCWLLENKKI